MQDSAETFAANRARGRIALGVAARAGRTHRTSVHEDGSLRVRFPNAEADALEAVIVNTGGGMTGGDCFSIDISLDEGAVWTPRWTSGFRSGQTRGFAGCRRKPFCSTARG
jgi:urease accessory protein